MEKIQFDGESDFSSRGFANSAANEFILSSQAGKRIVVHTIHVGLRLRVSR